MTLSSFSLEADGFLMFKGQNVDPDLRGGLEPDPALRPRGEAARGPDFWAMGSRPRAAPPRGSSAGSGSWAMIPSQIGMFRQEARSWGQDLPSRGGGPSHLRVWKSGPRAAPPRRSSAGSGSKSSLILRCALSQQEYLHIFWPGVDIANVRIHSFLYLFSDSVCLLRLHPLPACFFPPRPPPCSQWSR